MPVWSCDFTSLPCGHCSNCHSGMSSCLNPTRTSSGFHISGQKGSWQISCSHCLSSSQLFTSMGFSGFSLERDLACCFPFSYIPFLVHPGPGCMNSQFPFLCACADSLDSKVLCSAELLQGTAGTRGCPSGHQHQPPGSCTDWHLRKQTCLESMSHRGDVLRAELSNVSPVITQRITELQTCLLWKGL